MELVGGFACVVLASSVGGEALAHFCVAMKIVFKAGCYVLPLRNEGDALGKILADFVEQKRVVGAAKDDGVD